MKLDFVSIKSAVLDWMDDNDFGHEELDERLLIRWAGDCVKWCSSQDQLRHRIGVFIVENSRFRLPDDFQTLLQAAAKVDYVDDCNCEPLPDCCKDKSIPKNGRIPRSRREDIVQWVQGTFEKDCNLEINLICPKCKTNSCSCDTPVVEVDVDRIWEMSHPEIYFSHHTRVGRFGNGPGQNSPYASAYNPQFKLMRYASNNFHKLRQVIGDCPNVNCDNCRYEFILEKPYMEVNFNSGEVLMAYLGKTLDEDGELMIPDHPDIHEAIGHHLTFKWFRRKWTRKKDDHARAVSQEAMALRDKHMAIAKDEIDIPEFHEFKSYLENSAFMKRIAGWSTDFAGKRVPNFSERYGNRLNRGDYRY